VQSKDESAKRPIKFSLPIPGPDSPLAGFRSCLPAGAPFVVAPPPEPAELARLHRTRPVA